MVGRGANQLPLPPEERSLLQMLFDNVPSHGVPPPDSGLSEGYAQPHTYTTSHPRKSQAHQAGMAPVPSCQLKLLLTIQTNRLTWWRPHGDDWALNERRGRSILVVVEHRVERPSNVLSLELHIDGIVDKLGFALGLA